MIALLDANVLHPAPLRDFLLRLADAGLIQPKWSEEILDECFRSILRGRPELEGRLARTRERMNEAFPDALVGGHQHRISRLQLPDPEDRHILAAALEADADLIVTWNKKHFPESTVGPLGIRVLTPDQLAMELIAAEPSTVLETLLRQAEALQDPPQSPEQVLASLERCCLSAAGEALRALLRRG